MVTLDDNGQVVPAEPGDVRQLLDSLETRPFKSAELFGTIGSQIGSFLGGENPLARVVGSAVVSTIALNIGQALDAGGASSALGQAFKTINENNSNWFSGFGQNFTQAFIGAGVGSFSSYLALELGEGLGLEGFGAELFNVGASSVLNRVFLNVTNAQSANLFAGINWPEALGNIAQIGETVSWNPGFLPSAIGSFFGAKLGALVVAPQTQAAGLLSSIGSAAGAYMFGVGAAASGQIGAFAANLAASLGKLGNFVVPGIGAFVGFVLGALIGNLFGRKKPKTPTANAEVYLDYTSDQFQLGASSAANGGNLQLVKDMANTARDTLNGFLTVLAGDMPYQATSWARGLWRNGNYVSAEAGLQTFYGHTGGQLWVKLGSPSGAQQNVGSADDAVSKGVLWSIKQTKVIGGDIFAKRALYRSTATDLTALLGDLRLADDFRKYMGSAAFVDGAISEAWNKLSAADKSYYAANKAVMLRIAARTDKPLTSTDTSFYTANKAQIDRILGAMQVSQFAAGWIVTLQRAAELQLGEWAPSDFYGGMQGFLTSLGVTAMGARFEDLRVYQVSGGMQMMFGTQVPDGVFSLLPQARTNGRSLTVAAGTLATIGYTRLTSGNTSGNDFVDMSTSSAAVTLVDQHQETTEGYWEWRGPGLEPDVPTFPDPDGSPGAGYVWVPGTTHFVTGGDDIFIGGAGGDTLSGMGGWDWLDGGAGDDVLLGGDGDDVLLGGTGLDELRGGEGADYLFGGGGEDVLYGDAGDDTLIGGSGADQLYGGAGDDVFIIEGNGHGDVMDGGAGSNTLSFERAAKGVYIWLRSNTSDRALDGSFAYDYTRQNIWGVIGTAFADEIRGGAYADTLRGGNGDDLLWGFNGNDLIEGGAGADDINGEGGIDTVTYESSSAGVFVDLTTGEAFGGHATGDTITQIENLTGSRFADELRGNSAVNVIEAGEGDDWIVATKGLDTYNGGEGLDTVDYSLGFSTSGTVLGLRVQGGTATWRATDGATGTHSLVGVEHVIGTAGADTISLTAADEYITAGKGNDTLNGGAGGDTYYFDIGDGVDTVQETNVGTNVLSFGEGIGFNQLTFSVLDGPSGYLQVHYSATDSVRVLGALPTVSEGKLASADDNKIKVLDMNGSGQLDVSQFERYTAGTSAANTLAGLRTLGDLIAGYGGNDAIHGAQAGQWEDHGNIIIGGAGNDTITTSGGDDQFAFERGSGRDTITDAGGEDTLVFGPNVAADDVIYKVVGNNLYVGIADAANPNLEANQVTDYVRVIGGGVKWNDVYSGAQIFNTVEFINAGGTWIDLRKLDINWTVQNTYTGGVLPIVFDLAGDGLELTGVDDSMVVSRLSSGELARTSWVGPTDGILAFDRDGDGHINRLSEISFAQDKEGAETDLEGLQAWDTNGDGKLNALDAGWGDLKVWVDRNQNGRSTETELRTLDEAGITEISLTGVATGNTAATTRDSFVHNTLSFTWASGETGTAYDVQLARKLLDEFGLTVEEVRAAWGDGSAGGELGRLVDDSSGDETTPAGVAGGSVGQFDRPRLAYDDAEMATDGSLADFDRSDASLEGPGSGGVSADFSDHDNRYAEDEARWANELVGRLFEERALSTTDPSVRASLEAFLAGEGRGAFGRLLSRPQIEEGVAPSGFTTGSEEPSPHPVMSSTSSAATSGAAMTPVASTGGSATMRKLAYLDLAADLLSQSPSGLDVWAPAEFSRATVGGANSWWRMPVEDMHGSLGGIAIDPSGPIAFDEVARPSETVSRHQQLVQALAGFGPKAGASASAIWKRSGESHGEQLTAASADPARWRIAAPARMPA